MPIPRWVTQSASFVLGAATAAIGVVIQSKSAPASSKKDRINYEAVIFSPRTASSSLSADMLPTPPIRIFQPNESLLIAFDSRTKNPLYVLERLKPSQLFKPVTSNSSQDSSSAAASRKNKRFHEETSLPPYFRSRNHQYRNSGYDRGHLAPCADFPYDDEEMSDTFTLINISPQLPRFNRGVWLRLEDFVRDVVKSEGREKKNGEKDGLRKHSEKEVETWVVSGPLWLPQSFSKEEENHIFRYGYEGIGKPPSLIWVPTHFFKVIMVVSTQDGPNEGGVLATRSESGYKLRKFAAFVLPNSDIKQNDKKESNEIRLIDYVVRVTDLEAVTGMEFFPALLGSFVSSDCAANEGHEQDFPIQKKIADCLTDDVRFHSDGKQLGAGRGNFAMELSADKDGSKGHQKRVRKVLRDNAPIPFQHLCYKNDSCFRALRI